MSVLAIIPARGGSKGIPRKNLQMVGGKPLIAYTLIEALKARQINDVVVSTDDSEIADVASGFGIPIIDRPPDLAADHTPTYPVLMHALSEFGGDTVPDIVVTLQPTSPLRRADQIDEALRVLAVDLDAVVSVTLAAHTPYKMFRLEDGMLGRLYPDVDPGTPRQELEPVYQENGAIYATWTATLQDQASIRGRRTGAYVMDAESSIDIDTPLDLALAELVLTQRSVHSE